MISEKSLRSPVAYFSCCCDGVLLERWRPGYELFWWLPSRHAASSTLLVAGLLTTTVPVRAALYEFDSRRTEVRFSYTMAYAVHRGRFTKVTGALNYDAKAPERSKVTASISAASISTGDPLVEGELRSAKFFNVDMSPMIVFESLKVHPSSTTSADVVGRVTIKGITKRVNLKVKIKPHNNPALKYDVGVRRFVATTRIRRSSFNMRAYDSFVGDDIVLVIDAIVRPRRKPHAKKKR